MTESMRQVLNYIKARGVVDVAEVSHLNSSVQALLRRGIIDRTMDAYIYNYDAHRKFVGK